LSLKDLRQIRAFSARFWVEKAADVILPLIRPANRFEQRTIDWLWPGRIALGKLSVLEGDPGLGKSGK
jgi:hypothetical protein